MEITRAYDGDGEKKEADPSVECYAHSLEHDGLTNGTYKGQAVADEVEFRNLANVSQSLNRSRIAIKHAQKRLTLVDWGSILRTLPTTA